MCPLSCVTIYSLLLTFVNVTDSSCRLAVAVVPFFSFLFDLPATSVVRGRERAWNWGSYQRRAAWIPIAPIELFSFVSTISPWKKINGISLYLAVTDKSPRNRLLVARSSEVDRYTESNDGPFLKERLIFRNLRCILNSWKCIHGDDNNRECWPDFSTTSVDEQGFSRVSSWTVGSLPGNLRARDVEWPTGSKHKTADFGRSSTSIEHFISYVRKFSPTTDRGTNRLFSGARSNERSNSSLKRVHLLHGRHFANCLIVGRDEELIKMGEETRLPRKIHSATIFLREKSGKFFSASHPLTLAARQKF